MIRKILIWRRRTDEDFSDEIRAHIDLEIDRLVGEGMSPSNARSAAMRAFGNVGSAKERFHEKNHWMLLEQLLQDLRYAGRNLRHSPAFLLTTVLTLAIGLGLVSVVFTVFNAYVLRPFAVRDPGSLYKIALSSPDGGTSIFRWSDYEVVRERSDLFSDVVGQSTRFVSSTGEPLAAVLASDNYFAALSPRFALGRPLSSSERNVEAAVISYQFWERRFAHDPAVLARTLDINGRSFAIVGVLKPDFTGLDEYPRDVWVPLTAYASVLAPELTGRDQPVAVEIIARLRPDVSQAHATSALTPDLARLSTNKTAVRAELMPDSSPYPLSPQLLAVTSPVFLAFGLVLFTACANVSNVMLARAISRHREIALRLSLGASRGRVVRQLLTEGLVIALFAGAAALGLAFWTLRTGTAVFFGTLPSSVASIFRVEPLAIDHRVFLFALLAAASTTLLFALVPSLRASRLTLTDALRGQGGSSRRSRLRSGLVVVQVAVSLVLIVLAITFIRNGSALGRLEMGYDAHGVTSINIRGDANALVAKVAAELENDPRVAEIAVTNGNPTFVRTRQVAVVPDGGATAIATRFTFVSPQYFPILRIPIVSGRSFTLQEAASNAPVAVVSTATARTLWGPRDAVGQTIRIERAGDRPVEDLPGYTEVTVIGIAPDVVSGFVVDGTDAGHVYLPTAAGGPYARALLVRGRAADSLPPHVLEEIFARAARDPQVFEALPLQEMRALQTYPLMAASWIGAGLASIALLLSIGGLYGVLSYTLSQRTREIGIRIALGSTASGVVKLVMEQSVRLAAIGAGVGLAIAFAAMKTLAAVIPFKTVSMLDAFAFGGAIVLVMGATALAAYRPAIGATRVDPALTLRADG